MKVGIVKHLNARPLTWYFEKNPEYTPIYENPSVLIELLKMGALDFALVSSIECERNKEALGYSRSVGVCAMDMVRSVLYFEKKGSSLPISQIYTDSGSKSSVALLQCLLYFQNQKTVEVVPTKAQTISEMMGNGIGNHLLFGDHALLQKPIPSYTVKDLAQWWNEVTGLGFCFAFWAYPKEKPLEPDLFLKALSFGWEHIDEIIQEEKRLPFAIVERYLKKELQFIPTDLHLQGFAHFIDTAKKLSLL